jgi:hypothetical protein
MPKINKSYQKDLFLDQLETIRECKENGMQIELIFTDELVCDQELYDFEMFKIVYDNCEDKKRAKDEIENYILKGTTIDSKDNNGENEIIKDIKIIVQFLHQISESN